MKHDKLTENRPVTTNKPFLFRRVAPPDRLTDLKRVLSGFFCAVWHSSTPATFYFLIPTAHFVCFDASEDRALNCPPRKRPNY